MTGTSKNRWLILTIICFGGGIVYIMPYIQYSYYEVLREAFELSHQQMGNLMSTLGIVNAVAYLIGGVFADKFNVRWLVSISLAATGVIGFWFASGPSYFQLHIIMVLYGVTTVMLYWPSMVKAVKMLGSEEEQGRMFGFREAGFNIFSLIITQIGAWFVFNRASGMDSVQNIMIYFCIIYFIAAIVSAIIIPNSPKTEQVKIDEKKVSTLQGILYVAKIPSVWCISLMMFFIYSVSGAGLGKLTPYFTNILGLDEALVGSLMSIRMYLVGFIAAVLGGIIADKMRSAAKFIMVACAGLFISLLALCMIPGGETTAIVVVVVGFIASVFVYALRGTYWAPMGQARIPNAYVGTAIGLISFIGYLPDAFMNSVFGYIMGETPGEAQFKNIFLVLVIFAAIACGMAYITNLVIRKRQEKVPEFNEAKE